jgi:dihydroorotate dehydrogenase electron transfer subunit
VNGKAEVAKLNLMTNPLTAPYYPRHACSVTATVLANECIAKSTYRLRLLSPEIASKIWPGQFVMVRIHGRTDPLIGRPLAMYAVEDTAHGLAIDVVYVVKGKFTTAMQSVQAGDEVDVWGPLGNGFKTESTEHLLIAAGGIGYTPFVAVIKEALGKQQFGSADSQSDWPADLIQRQTPYAQRVTVCYGAREAAYFAGLDDFEAAGATLKLATDDGSRGHAGLVTDIVSETISESSVTRILCCGPEKMMQAVAEIAISANIPCQVSLETPMACGIGICFTCVAKIKQPEGDWDYKRTCVEGPVFDAAKIEW